MSVFRYFIASLQGRIDLGLMIFPVRSLLLCANLYFFASLQGRRLVSDFGMLTAICTMVLVAYMLRDLVVVETLVVPAGWTNSNSTVRGWFINPLDGRLSIWEIFGAMVPAALVCLPSSFHTHTHFSLVPRLLSLAVHMHTFISHPPPPPPPRWVS